MAQDYIDERLEQELEAPASFTSQEVLYKDLIRSIYKYHPSDDITMVEKAYIIAREAHKDQKRKSGEPYIIHPLCVAIILADLELDKESIIAGILHDVVEDAGVTREQLEEAFGDRVSALVMAETEDKSRSWLERKTATIEHLRYASREEKILVLGDKLSNIRSTAKDYLLEGERFWDRFNEKRKESHCMYYEGVGKELEELKGYPAYQEYIQLCQLVFHGQDLFLG